MTRRLVACWLLLAPAAQASTGERLDALLAARWAAGDVAPATVCDDATFVRRAWLDLAGRVPPAAEVTRFVNNKRGDKRARLVDDLLAGPAFAEHWGYAWATRLTQRRPNKQDTHDGYALAEWLRERMAGKTPYDRVVSDMITAEGLQDANGAVNYLLRYEAKPEVVAGAVGRQFLGITLGCAQCHDHKSARWRQDDFWGVAAFFARTKRVTAEGDDQSRRGVLEARRGELTRPDPNGDEWSDEEVPTKVIAPQVPGGKPITAVRRRAELAAWVTARDNPYFARNTINQVWDQLFGTPLVRTLDDLPAVVRDPWAPVLDLLADDFAAGGFDFRRPIRAIVLSRAYAAAAAGVANPEAAEKQRALFARFPVRPLTADQLYRSVVQATGHTGEPDPPPSDDERPNVDRPAEFFGVDDGAVPRALAVLNGPFVHDAVEAGAKKLTEAGGPTDRKLVTALFLATLSRRPADAEADDLLALVKDGGEGGVADALWALFNSAEFTTNH